MEGVYSGEMPVIARRELAEGALRAGIELPMFRVGAAGEFAAASAGRPVGMEGFTAPGGPTDPALQEKIGSQFQGSIDTLKEMAFGAEPGALAIEEGLSIPFAVIGMGPRPQSTAC